MPGLMHYWSVWQRETYFCLIMILCIAEKKKKKIYIYIYILQNYKYLKQIIQRFFFLKKFIYVYLFKDPQRYLQIHLFLFIFYSNIIARPIICSIFDIIATGHIRGGHRSGPKSTDSFLGLYLHISIISATLPSVIVHTKNLYITLKCNVFLFLFIIMKYMLSIYLTVLNFVLNQFLYHFKIPCFIIFNSLFLLLWMIISLYFMQSTLNYHCVWNVLYK